MNQNRARWIVIGFFAAALGFMLASSHRNTADLQRELAREKRVQHQRAALRASAEAKNPSGDRAEQTTVAIEADRLAIAALREEVQRMKARAETRNSQSHSSAKITGAPTHSILQEMLTAEQWRDSGQATPSAAVETLLWAAAAGEVESLANLLSIDPVVRTQVNSMLMSLPDSLRKDYGTPERLIALLVARDIPLGAAQIHDFNRSDLSGTKLSLIFRDVENRRRAANLTLRQESEGWKLVVPSTAVKKYAAMLKGASSGSDGTDVSAAVPTN